MIVLEESFSRHFLFFEGHDSNNPTTNGTFAILFFSFPSPVVVPAMFVRQWLNAFGGWFPRKKTFF